MYFIPYSLYMQMHMFYRGRIHFYFIELSIFFYCYKVFYIMNFLNQITPSHYNFPPSYTFLYVSF